MTLRKQHPYSLMWAPIFQANEPHVCILTSFTSYSLGYLIAAVSPSTTVSIIVMPLILIIMLVVAGFMIRDPQLPKFIAWFRYLSLYRWGFFALLLTEFPPGGFFGTIPNGDPALIGTLLTAG